MSNLTDSINRQFISINEAIELICHHGKMSESEAIDLLLDDAVFYEQIGILRSTNRKTINYANYIQNRQRNLGGVFFMAQIDSNGCLNNSGLHYLSNEKNSKKDEEMSISGLLHHIIKKISSNYNLQQAANQWGFGRKKLYLTLQNIENSTGVYLPHELVISADSYTGSIYTKNPDLLQRAYDELAKNTAKLQHKLRNTPEPFQHKISNQAPSTLEQIKNQIENAAPQPAPKSAPTEQAKIDPRREKSLLKMMAIYAHMAKADTDQPHKQAEVLAEYAAANGLEAPSETTIARTIEKINFILKQ
jgi:hypothetical protein